MRRMLRGERSRASRSSRPFHVMRPAFTDLIPASASSSSDWPFPATPAMPTISPRRTVKVIPLTRSTPRASSITRPLTSSSGSPGWNGCFSTVKVTDRPTISSASCADVVSAVGSVATIRGDHVRDLADLAQLVGDEEDAPALPRERLENPEEVIGFAWSQDGGRLVQDQDVGATVQRLQDLHALALSHAEIGDTRVRIDLEVVLLPEPRELGPGCSHAGAEPEASFDAKHHVLQDAERLHQHEVLVHHADPGRQRVPRASNDHRSSVDQDLSAVRPMVTVEDTHQRRLARAVLTDDAVDRSGAHDEGHAAVRADWAEPLVDVSELDGRRRRSVRSSGHRVHRRRSLGHVVRDLVQADRASGRRRSSSSYLSSASTSSFAR